MTIQKEKRTDSAATLDVVGRDQLDQRLYLTRYETRLTWDFDRKERDVREEPPDPLLEEIAKRVTRECPYWFGTPTELVALLGVDMKANTLTLKLNVSARRLFNEYGILYKSSRRHDGRRVELTLQSQA